MAFKPRLLVPVVGNRAIDHYHARLADLLTEAQAMLHCGDAAGLGTTVAGFRVVIAEHFAQEEVIIRGAGFERSDEHSLRHREILVEIDTVIAGLDDARQALAQFTAVDVLSRILYDHEIADDYDYRDSIRGKNDGAVPWSADLGVGVPWIDEQHQILVAMVNEIDLADRIKAPPADMRSLFATLVKSIRQHFDDEEAQLSDWGVDATEHHRQHAELMGQLDALIADEGEGKVGQVGDFLKFWLLDHIRSQDRADFTPAAKPPSHWAGPPGSPG